MENRQYTSKLFASFLIMCFSGTGEIVNMIHDNGEIKDLEPVTDDNPAWFGNGIPVICIK